MATATTQVLAKQKRLDELVELVKVKPMTALQIAKELGVSDSTGRAYVKLVPELRVIDYVPSQRTYAAVYAIEGKAITLDEFLNVTGLEAAAKQRNRERTRIKNLERNKDTEVKKKAESYVGNVPFAVHESFQQLNCSVRCFNGRIYKRVSSCY